MHEIGKVSRIECVLDECEQPAARKYFRIKDEDWERWKDHAGKPWNQRSDYVAQSGSESTVSEEDKSKDDEQRALVDERDGDIA